VNVGKNVFVPSLTDTVWIPRLAAGTVKEQVPVMFPLVVVEQVVCCTPSNFTTTVEPPLKGFPPLLTLTEVPTGPDVGIRITLGAAASYVGETSAVADGAGFGVAVALKAEAPSAFATSIRPKLAFPIGSVVAEI